MAARPRVAIAHDYFTQRGGAERVALAMLRAFPDATLYTTVYNPETTFPELRDARVMTLPLNNLAALQRDHRFGLPLYQGAIDRAPVIDADVLLVSTTGFAHGFRTTGRKLVYCHSPARFLYLAEDYLGGAPAKSPVGWLLSALRPKLVHWDQRAARSADRYLANSTVVRQRISDVYGIDATVVPAPPAVNSAVAPHPIAALADWDEGFYLVVSRLLPYKNVDKVIAAFRELPMERLAIVGRGPLSEELRRDLPVNVRMLEGLTDGELAWAYGQAAALIAPSFEDYGLTPLEAAALGTPTLALRAGGYLDTVVAGVTGAFFDAPTAGAIGDAVRGNTGRAWDASQIRAHATAFDESHFAAALRRHVAELVPHSWASTEDGRPR
ncbi:glycosyltransferase [Tessaracoccus sp. MC1627]|uniref:glycosyltransferase n=1 Tax=Tessaracoccus sp. MC1627 TaxID=2760312 RepID=UPI0015FF2604|nr:glycosyltransferase [Tessaracoccus sp. MC1627]MBB1513185.1 glycosyltransferase [Tessaracoccus sp. MC1627]MBB1513482.1 glycosyltransferase [Tessaracoccus sp. MC1627]